MKKVELIKEVASAEEQLKDYKRFIDLLKDKDDPKGILTRLNRTVSRIKMLLEASDIKELAPPNNEALQGSSGALVRIKPCDKQYGDKTYLGFLIGEIALGSSMTISDGRIQLNYSGYNPAIFVPELKKVIYGCASWWGEIENESELKEITNDEIENVWYVKMLRSDSKLKK